MGIFCAFGGMLGFRLGEYCADRENKEKYLTEFKTEEYLYHLLDTQKKPILMFYYIPGEYVFMNTR
jgi:hypothetical protein